MSAQVAATPNHLVTDPHGARYEILRTSEVAPIESVARRGRIVVGIDGSEESVSALRRAVRIASALDANIEAVTSWRIPAGYVGLATEYTPADDARSILSGAAKSVFGAKNPIWFTSSSFEGNAADILIEQSRDAEMLIVGSRGHGGLAGVLLGSVSAMCAEHAHCPVLIVH